MIKKFGLVRKYTVFYDNKDDLFQDYDPEIGDKVLIIDDGEGA